MLPDAQAPLCDPDIYTTQNVRDIAAEIIREKCFEFLHQEIPYGLAVRILKFIEDNSPVTKIYSEIVVSKENHRNIVIGTGGKSIKMIGQNSRLDLEKILGKKVFLDLHVKVKKNWMSSDTLMQELGYGTEQ
jgi:GTP-binding protein Era